MSRAQVHTSHLPAPVEGVYRPWEPHASGRWQSQEIAVAIGLEGALATADTRDGKRRLHGGEIAEGLEHRDAALARKDAALEAAPSTGQSTGGAALDAGVHSAVGGGRCADTETPLPQARTCGRGVVIVR